MEERGVTTPGAVQIGDLREWVVELRASGLAASSIRRAQSAVRTYFGFLLAEGVITEDPSDRLDTPRMDRTLPDFLGREEVLHLLESPDPGHALKTLIT